MMSKVEELHKEFSSDEELLAYVKECQDEHARKRGTWLSWHQYYKTNPDGLSYEELVHHIEQNDDIKHDTFITSLFIETVQKTYGYKDPNLIPYLTVQQDAVLREYIRRGRPDAQLDVGVISSRAKDVEHKYDQGSFEEVVESIVKARLSCYIVAASLGIDLDYETNEYLKRKEDATNA